MSCEHCGSTNGHWSSKNIWLCSDCNKITIYYEVTELGKQAVKELLTESVASDTKRKGEQNA